MTSKTEKLIRIKKFIDIKSHDINEANEALQYISQKIEETSLKLETTNKSIVILTDVLSITQEEIIKYIETVVTSALQYIYGDEYTFHAEYQLKRNQPEVELFVTKGDIQYDWKSSCGVGVLNICSFALRCVCWSLIEPRTEPILIVDEPFSSISGIEQLEKAEYMVSKLHEMLGIQIIIISGKPPVTNYAEKIFYTKIENGNTMVTNER